jgi:hypothetical protein
MNDEWNRRRWLKHLAASSAALVLPRGMVAAPAMLEGAPADREIQIVSVSPHTVRLTVLPIRGGQTVAIPSDGSLVQRSWGDPVARLRGNAPAQEFELAV